ncbi:MAG: class I SAM-dependent methyltransferase [Bryobacteraceae bacterium]
MRSLPDYGIDAPGVVRALAIGGAVLLSGGTATAFFLQGRDPATAGAFFRAGLWWGGAWLLTATIMFWSSRVGKLRVRDRLIGSLHWTGAEQVLDVGCGSGLALIGAAKRLTSGRAIGIDVWSTEDLSTNKPDTAAANALAEGVIDRVQLHTGDARDIPFPSASFDAVISMTAIHNIGDPTERETALGEMLRVLKPGGQLAIFDIFYAGKYAGVLRQLGAEDVRSSGLILLWCVPGRRIIARKRQ